MLSLEINFPAKLSEEGIPVESARQHYESIVDPHGSESNMLGWLQLHERIAGDPLRRIQDVAAEIREQSDVFVSAGIGGSYLGARAVIEALKPHRSLRDRSPEVLFAGHHLSGPYHDSLLKYLDGKNVYVNAISKSGTTTETALAFRLLLNYLDERWDPEDVSDRIVVTTDAEQGALKEISEKRGFRSFVIPDDVGGRYSVLTPVGLLPIAVAGINVEELLEGAGEAARQLRGSMEQAEPAIRYAAARNYLYEEGYGTEIFASFYRELRYFGKWWQQLFGESEGKEGKGIYPATVDNTTDLHSMGQYIQDGPRNLFETFLRIESRPEQPVVPDVSDAVDGLDELVGMTLEEINRQGLEGTIEAHREGGVPVMTMTVDELNANRLGQLIYFFEFSCALSALTLGVNPFNQPGVEAYKNNMNNLLGLS